MYTWCILHADTAIYLLYSDHNVVEYQREPNDFSRWRYSDYLLYLYWITPLLSKLGWSIFKLVRKDMDVSENENDRLSNITLRHKLK